MDYTISSGCLTVTVCDFGAELQSVKGADGTEYLWQGDPAFWQDRAPNIFPYVARMTDGRCTVNGDLYEMQIHGLVKYRTLRVEEQAEDCIVFCLDSDGETRARYPYEFTYRITYALRGNLLTVTSSVENRGAERMYFGLGGHPGFRVPLEEGLAFEDYYLRFSQPSHPSRVIFTDDCFVAGREVPYPLVEDRKLPLRHSLFDRDAIVLKHAAREVCIMSDRGMHSITVSYPDFPYIGFWHSPGCAAPYVCVEPWSSLPSRDGIIEELSQQSDLIGLDAGKEYSARWSIRLEQSNTV